MFREEIPARQLAAWLCAAMIPVLVQLLAGVSWVWVLLAGLMSVLVVWIVWRSGAREYPKWLWASQLLFTIVLLGQLLEKTGESWPTGHQIVVPLILLAVAAWSVLKGPSAAARVGGVLFWFIIIMYLAVFGAGVREVELEWLKPELSGVSWLGFALLLLPAGATALRRPGEKWGVRLVLPAVFALAASLITIGVLSPLAAGKGNAFYELSRSLNLLGIARRFEAVVSAAMTVGWFALISMLLTFCGKHFEKLFDGHGKVGVFVGAALSGAWALCGLHIKPWIVCVCAAVFWVLPPLLAQGIDARKKS